jgi:hypothetical protein
MSALDDLPPPSSSPLDSLPPPQQTNSHWYDTQAKLAGGLIKSASNMFGLNPSKSAGISAPDLVGGTAETVANAALGTAGALAGGLGEVAGLVTGSTDRAQRWHDWLQRNVSTVAGLYDPAPETRTGEAIQNVLNSAGEGIKNAGGWVGEKALQYTKSPVAATAADVGTQGALQAALTVLGAKGAGVATRGLSRPFAEIKPTLDQGWGIESVSAPTPMVAQSTERPIIGGGAASVNSNPYPKFNGEVSARGGDFPQIKLTQGSGDVELPEQQIRASVYNEITGSDRARPGVVTGNEDTLRTEAAQAKASDPTPTGLLLRDKMAEEQRSLDGYADSIISKTGASGSLINDAQRGDLMNSALYGPDSLRSFLADQKDQIYKEADQRQGVNSVSLPTLEKALNDPTLDSSLQIAGQPNFLNGVRGLYQQFQTNGFRDKITQEQIPPNTVAAAMQLHKALNSAWTPENSGWIGGLKKSILDDAAQAGGADLYQKGNAIHEAEKILLNAPGVKKIFGDVDPNTGIAKGLSSEKIVPAINNLPFDQYSHIYNIFDSMSYGKVPGAEGIALPPELQAAASQAKAEMTGSLVRDVYKAGADKAGAWNANSANKVLNAHTQKLNLVADPEVMRSLHTLNVGGQIMPNMHSYEGAAQQARRLDQAGLLERNLSKIGAVAGSMTGIPGAEFVGGRLGEKQSTAIGLKRQMKQAEELDAKMEAASKLGKK